MSCSSPEPDAPLSRSPSRSHSRSHSRSLSSLSHTLRPPSPERRPSTQFPYGEFSLELERFHAQSDHRLSFRTVEIEECSSVTSAGKLVWVENRRHRLSGAAHRTHRSPTFITELRYLKFERGVAVPRFLKRHEFRQAVDNLWKYHRKMFLTTGWSEKDYENEPASPLNAHVAEDALEQLQARRENAKQLSGEFVLPR